MLGRMGVSYPAGGVTVAARMLLDHISPIRSCVKMSRDRAQSSRAQSRKVELLLLGWAGMGRLSEQGPLKIWTERIT